MTDLVQSRLESSDMLSLVSQTLGKSIVKIPEWQFQPLGGGAGKYSGGLGVFRVSGTARDQDGSYPWSLILKIISGSGEGSQDQAAWNYWKREVLIYQSGLIANLPGSLTAPRCYAVVEYPGDEFWLWLEDIPEADRQWTMTQHSLVARHLGEFNGAYLAGHPLPEAQPWMTWGRAREWATTFAQPRLENTPQHAKTTLGRRWFPGDSFERSYEVWANHQRLLEAFERLPVCYCHHDAFRRNLFARQNAAGAVETVAIDWSITGFGRVGEEIGMATANNLLWMDVPVNKAEELDEAIFSGYIEGLQAAGWQGDVRLARLGYTVNAVIPMGMAWPLFHLTALQDANHENHLETMIGYPLNDIIETWSSVQLFLLDLADEAFRLADGLNV
jgi:hypothetical protein